MKETLISVRLDLRCLQIPDRIDAALDLKRAKMLEQTAKEVEAAEYQFQTSYATPTIPYCVY